ncbi:hypothetical protein ACQKIY_11015 [Bacillus mycoides]|uniref:hypothetical protein n=1 Tax=Bacillus mycoides TaxID=1405 RepID=UPI003D04B2CC
MLVEHDFLLMMYLNQSGVKEQWSFLFTSFFEGAVCCSLTWDKVKSIALIEEKSMWLGTDRDALHYFGVII